MLLFFSNDVMLLWESRRSIQYICTLLISPQTTCHRHCLPRAVYKHPQVCTTTQQTASRQAGDIGPALGRCLVFAGLSCQQTHLVTRRTRCGCSVANTIRFISNFHKYMCTPISASSGMFWFSSAAIILFMIMYVYVCLLQLPLYYYYHDCKISN